MANVIPNVGEIKFELNDTATTLTCELNTKFGVTVYGAFASKNFNRDINTGLAQTSALLEALENLKEHLEFHSAVEDWTDDTSEEYEDDYDFWEYDEEEDDYDFWEDCSDDDEPEDKRKNSKTDLETIASVLQIISALLDYDGSSRVKN